MHKQELYEQIPPGSTFDILLIYLDKELWDFEKTEKSVKAALEKIGTELNDNSK